MLWAAACMCFFGFLRMGEAVVPSAALYDPEVHLSSEADVRIDNRTKPSYIEVRVKASKTDVFHKGITIYLGATGNDLCPVAAILSYTVSNPRSAVMELRLFFRFSDGQPLTRETFVKELQSALQSRGINTSVYTGHSSA